MDDPYYFGEEADVVIKDGEKKSIALKCKVANALASVLYDDESQFSEMFSEYGVEIKVESNSVLLKNGTKESAYYQANSKPVFTFKGTIKDNGKKVESVLENEELSKAEYFSAAQHCKLTLSLKPATAGLIPTISKVEATTVTINETIPMKWLPAPKVSSTGFDESKVLMYYETAKISNASIDFDLASALQDLDFSLNFQDENLAKKGLNKEYKLSEMTLEEQAAIRNIGINLPVIGESSPQIEFTSDFYSLLRAENEDVVENSIYINSVTANNRTNKDENPIVYTIKTCKPEFSVSVLPGNIWTKEFTAEEITVSEGKGDLETLKDGGIKYQYSSDGGTLWQDFNDSSRQYFESCPSNKSYMIRAIYRDAIVSEPVNIDLETPVQLPNSGMEEWYEVDQSDNKNLWFPFIQEGEQYWYTNNLETTNYRRESFCSTSAVKRTENKHSGNYAAWIRTVGHGIANTNVDSFLGINGSITGTHTIGVLYYSSPFSVRPTKIQFYGRYVPNGDDVGLVDIKIENEEQNVVLCDFSYTITNTEYKLFEIPIIYENENIVATKFTLTFKSGSKNTDVVKAKVRGNGADEHYGSELYIDDISLVYEK